MPEAVIVVTGATHGLGYHAAKSLAKNLSQGGQSHYQFIVLSCRNVPSAKKVAAEIAKSTKTEATRLIVLDEPCDLADINSVRSYYSALKQFLGDKKILSLVNNAGIGGNPNYRLSAQGFDQIWATNHLGHFLLTILCLPHMAQNSRIVNVSSEVHDPATKTPLPDADEFWPQVSYHGHSHSAPEVDMRLHSPQPLDRIQPRPALPEAPAAPPAQSQAEYDSRLARGEPFPGENNSKSGQRRYARWPPARASPHLPARAAAPPPSSIERDHGARA